LWDVYCIKVLTLLSSIIIRVRLPKHIEKINSSFSLRARSYVVIQLSINVMSILDRKKIILYNL
jgi:hypothetical protein